MRQAAFSADVSIGLAESGTLQSILQACVESTVQHLNAAFARIWTLDEDKNVLELQASAGMYTHLDGPHSRVPLGEFKIGMIAQERRPHLTNEVFNDPRVSDKEWARREGLASFAGHPLIVEDRLVGVLAMFARDPLTEDIVEALASVADAIAQGIQRKKSEEALKESESSLAAAQKIAHVGNWGYNIGRDEARWSDEMYWIFGFVPQSFVPTYKTFLRSVHSDDRGFLWNAVREALYNGERSDIEYRIVRSDGEVRVVQTQYEVGHDERTSSVRLSGTVQDITERKRTEEKLRASEAELRALFAAMNDVVLVLDGEEGRCLRVASANPRLLYTPADEQLGKTLREVFPEEQANLFLGWIRSALETRQTVRTEYSLTIDGGQKWFSANISPMEDSVIWVLRDITERKKMEEALKDSEERFRSLIKNAPDVITLVDADGAILYDSPAVERVLGYGIGERVGDIGFDYIHPDDLGEAKRTFSGTLNTSGIGVPIDYRLRHKDGSWRHIEAIRANLLDDPAVHSIVINYRDVTERKEAERELKESEERLRSLADAAFEGILISDQGIVLEANRALLDMFGYEHSEVLGKSALELIAPEYRALTQRILSGYEEPFEVVALKKDGTPIDLEIRASMLTYQGRSARVTAVRDITKRKRAEEALRESEERHRRRARELALLHEVRSALAQELELPTVFRTVVESIARTYGYTLVSAYLLQEDDLVLQHQVGYEHVIERVSTDKGVMGRVARTGEAVLLRDVRSDPAFLGAIEGIVSEVCVPLLDEDRIVGTLNVESTESVELTEDDLRLMNALGEHVSIAIGRARLHTQIRESEERFRALIQNSSDLVTLYDADGTIRYVSPALERILGYAPEERIGTTSFGLIHPDDVVRAKEMFAKTLRSPDIPASAEVRARHRDGSWRYLEAVGTNLLAHPSVGAVVLNGRDITERKMLEQRLEYQAFHDDLTGLPNRALFMDRLEHAISRAKRTDGRLAVLFLDVDNLKVVNDSLGHEVGDELLIAAVGRLRACLRPADSVARLSGDEFAILLEDVEAVTEATQIAERFSEALRAPLILKGRETFITASIGISLSGSALGPVGGCARNSPTDSVREQAETLLRQADLAMYRAKNKGKAHYEVFDQSMNALVFERLEMGNDLRRALERDEFRVCYQPKVQLHTSLQQRMRVSGRSAIVAASEATKEPQIVGMEALVRWEHPERGLLSPDKFIPVAEESGLIVPIGRKVLEEACRQARVWQEECYATGEPLIMCVNISARQFQHPQLAQDVAQVLQQTGLEPGALELEITESVVMEDAHSTIDALKKLENLGVQIAIDDFGTGYSSLSYLKRFPVSLLKIDRSFITRLGEDPEDAMIVSGIISLAHTLGMQVVAEGVETAEQSAYLQGLGCDMAQGNYFSEPLSAAAASTLLVKSRYS